MSVGLGIETFSANRFNSFVENNRESQTAEPGEITEMAGR